MGLAGVVKDLVSVMEMQVRTDRPQKIFNPRDNVVPTFNPEDKRQSIEKWCQRIDELKDLYRWSDEVTVYSAITKLDGLASTWYGSLPTIQYNWEEWKVQLKTAFPPRRDFHESLQEMMSRNKQRNETYMVYYYEKLALMNECKIFGVDAVSCLLGGISDATVQAAARANNYASCETLLNFLKTCDMSHPRTSPAMAGFLTKGREHQYKRRQEFVQPKGKIICYKCQKPGHKSAECRAPRCFTCREYGHRAQQCRKPHQPKTSNHAKVENVL